MQHPLSYTRWMFIYQITKRSVVVNKFTQLSIKEREKLYIGIKADKSMRKIAFELKRSPSTISRELGRNTANQGIGYLPDTADVIAKDRKKAHKPKLECRPELKEYVLEKLHESWSPEMIAGRLKLEKPLCIKVCAETIYSFIYNKNGIKLELYKLLAKARPRRGIRYGRKPRGTGIPNRTSIHDRPKSIDERTEPGHFEGDLTFFEGNQSGNIGVIIERKSRFAFLSKNESKHTNTVMKSIFNKLASIPFKGRKTITFDNGKEFTKHTVLKKHLKMGTFFCDKHSPWQKGQVENANVLLHRFIPKKTPFWQITDRLVQAVQDKMNNLPRKCLDFRTPVEVFNEVFL